MSTRCWEDRNCQQKDCLVRINGGKYCWLSESRPDPDGQFYSFGERLYQQCRNCSYFRKILERSTGRRSNDRLIYDTFFKLLEEMGTFHEELLRSNRAFTQNIQNLIMLNEVTKAVQSTLDLDQILHIILTGATAAEVLSLNRAFLLLLNDDKSVLLGRMAVGPTGPEEAGKIWNEIQNASITFRDLAMKPHNQVEGNKYVNILVKELKIPISDDDNIAIRAITEKKSFLVADASAIPGAKMFSVILKVNSFVVVPLLAEDEALGVLMADNSITQTPINQGDLTLLEIFAGQVSNAIKNAKLFNQLQRKIQELKESQDKLIKAEKMAAIGEIAATLAHEMRTPIVSIGGFINSMIKQQPSDHPYDKQLRIISSEIERLEGVLSDTLEMSRFKEPELVQSDINTIIDDCLKLLLPEFEERGITVEVNYKCPGHQVWLDKLQFPQVFLNIFKNAIHAMPEGGKISIETRASEKGNIEITISDTGQGISQDLIDRIFEPRFTTKKSGSGIGLAFSKKIVSSHRGTIKAATREGGGVTFLIDLPLV